MEFVKSELGEDPIIVESYFPAAPERVFRAWTVPDEIMKWFGPTPGSLHSAAIDLRKGGAWQFLKSKDAEKSVGFEGEYLEIETGKRLLFTWMHVTAHSSGMRDATSPSQVEVTFTAKGKGTEVRLVHSRVHNDATRRGFSGGWNGAFTNLKALFGT